MMEGARVTALSVIRLLGRPSIERAGGGAYRLRSRKSWALLAYLLLSEAPPARSQLAELLFGEADDPLGALRWSLAELRRGLGDEAAVDGDPVVLRLPAGTAVDLDVLEPRWAAAVEVVGLGGELLDGLAVRGAPGFESWLLAERRRVAAASEAVLHEAALGLMAQGALDRARGFAVRAAVMSPLDEDHQALLIRLYRLMGDDAAAERQYAAWTALLQAELGVPPGVAVEAAMRERRREQAGVPTSATIEAALEAGSAAIAAGAVETGVSALRSAVRLADAGRDVRPPGAVTTGAGGGAHPLAAWAGRGRRGTPARGGTAGTGGSRRRRLCAGPRGARLRRLPAWPLPPGRALAQ